MILRNPKGRNDGFSPENVFEAVDPRSGEVYGTCTVTEEHMAVMFPDRPYHVRLDISGEDEALDMLLGAAFARARALCGAQTKPARIYASCAPEDAEMLARLRNYGFRDNDGLIRMRGALTRREAPKPPMGCVVVQDSLEDTQEQRYFLERYNGLYGENRSARWLAELTSRSGFRRILTVAPTGMAGEVAVWLDGDTGVIEFFDTARRWRNVGVAGCMISLACSYLAEKGAREAVADVRAKTPYARRTLESAGFAPDTLLRRYPGVDI